MKFLPVISVAVVSFFCASATDPDSEDTSRQSLPIHSSVMFASAVQDTMVIDVSLPASYDIDTTVQYPVLYLTDGYWRRGQHQPIDDMARKENIKEVIIVGIGYPDSYYANVIRVRDLINNPDRFLDFILHQLIPYVENNYRTNRDKTLWGSSYGGYFAMYALFNYSTNTKGVFRSYIVASAAALETTDFGGTPTDLFGFEQILATNTTELNVNLYITVGGSEESYRFLDPFKRLVQTLENRHYTGFFMKSYIDPSKDHSTVWEPTLYEGVRMFLSK